MILRALTAYYERLLAAGAAQPFGFHKKGIPWLIELDLNGKFCALVATGDGKRGQRFVVPMEVKKSRNIAANLLWDNPEYVLGACRDGADPKQAAKVPQRHAAFLKRLRALSRAVGDDAGLSAIFRFLEDNDHTALTADPRWSEIIRTNANISFRISGDTDLVCNRSAIREAVAVLSEEEMSRSPKTQCLVTGQREPLSRLHPRIQGVRGAQATGANLVSFNLDAFESHGWTQGENAPVGPRAAHAYGAALNHLLHRSNASHRQVQGDTTFVFWAGATTATAQYAAHIMGARAAAQEGGGNPPAEAMGCSSGSLSAADFEDPTPFHVLALAPNASRLAVRLWYLGSVGDVLTGFNQHFDDLTIDRFNANVEKPDLWRLLSTTAIGDEVSRLSDPSRGGLATQILNAILTGTPYPAVLLARVVERCRNERRVTSARAAVIKAILNRRARLQDTATPAITVSLDPENTNSGYLLGRLVAVFERTRRSTQPVVYAPPRNPIFQTAVMVPRSAVVPLTRMWGGDLKTLYGIDTVLATHLENLFASLLAALAAPHAIPGTLALEDQGRFMIGYHHQKAALWPSEATSPAEPTGAQ